MIQMSPQKHDINVQYLYDTKLTQGFVFRGTDHQALSKEEMDFETVHNIDEWGVESVSVKYFIFSIFDIFKKQTWES